MTKAKLTPLEKAYAQLEAVTDKTSERTLEGYFLEAYLELTLPAKAPNKRDRDLSYAIIDKIIEISDLPYTDETAANYTPEFEQDCERLFRKTAYVLTKGNNTDMAERFDRQAKRVARRLEGRLD